MKNLKRLFAGILALTLVMSTPIYGTSSAFAEEDSGGFITSGEIRFAPETTPASGSFKSEAPDAETGENAGIDVEWTYASGILTILDPGKPYTLKAFWDDEGNEELRKNVISVIIQGDVTLAGSFENVTNLQRVSLPDSVTEIPHSFFLNAVNLREVNIPSSLKVIEAKAFENCASLSDIKLTDSACLETIYNDAFKSSGIRTVEFPDTVTLIAYNAFCNCTQLEYVKLPSALETMGSEAFAYDTKLKELIIPEGVKTIGENAFQLCTGLTGLTIPGSVKTLEQTSFYNCFNLNDITVSEGVEAINAGAFGFNLDRLSHDTGSAIPQQYTRISLPSTLKTLEKAAFYGRIFDEVLIPDSVEAIGEGFCLKINKVTLGKGIKTLEDYPFSNSGLKEIVFNDNLETIGNFAFFETELIEISLPESLKSIGNSAFVNSKLTEVKIPKSVTEIGKLAFGYYLDEKGTKQTVENFTIKGYPDTAAQTYAKENDFEFIDISAEAPDETTIIPVTQKIGDINGDGGVTPRDLIPFIQHFLHATPFSEAQLIAADVTGDGEVNLLDLATLKQFSVGDKVAGPLSKLR